MIIMALKKTTLLFEEEVYNKLKALKNLKSLDLPTADSEKIEKEILKGASGDTEK